MSDSDTSHCVSVLVETLQQTRLHRATLPTLCFVTSFTFCKHRENMCLCVENHLIKL